ncbi:MAG: cyclic pyranopterin monophosphate synthase MoaC [Candidatus Didemnitutus sp.]|nr:cyclic pyranopterin monophosphate synthase MoaC [Candidatus Didemnitutus sp.]
MNPNLNPSVFSHLSPTGDARMVSVGEKPEQVRLARAAGRVCCAAATISLLRAQALPKGDVLTVAKLAGIQAAKATSALIPLCHPLLLTGIDLDFVVEDRAITIGACVRTTGRTGVEMEALTAVAVAALAIYDMCKAVDREMSIEGIHVVAKEKS